MISAQEIALLRSIRKTAAVLLLIMRLDKPVGETEIAQLLDISPETARTHLRSLSAVNLIARAYSHNGYILTAGGRQLVLAQSAENPRIPPPPPPPLIEGNTNSAQIRGGGDLESAENPRFRENITRLTEAGIGSPAREQIAKLKWMTTEYITYHHDRLTQEATLKSDPRPITGLLIHVLRSGDPIPPPQLKTKCTICGKNHKSQDCDSESAAYFNL
jgi:hypothetical protein